MSTATDLLKNLNGNTYNASTNPYGLDGVGGMDANLVAGFNAMGTAGDEVAAAAALAVPAATTATNAATTATTQADIAVAAANTAASLVTVKQPSEIAGIDPCLDFVFSGPNAVPSGVITGSSGKWVMGPNGLLTLVPAGTAPIDFDPITAAGRGLLVEESRTNLLTYSRTRGNAAWSKNRCSITENSDAGLDGTVAAGRIVADGTGGDVLTYQAASGSAATQYVYYDVLKAGTLTQAAVRLQIGTTSYVGRYFDLSAGTVGANTDAASPSAYGIVPMGGGYYLCWVSGVTASGFTSPVGLTYAVTGSAVQNTPAAGSYIITDGAQLTTGAFPASPIPTTSSTVTRSADVNTVALSSILGWNASEFTIFLEAMRPAFGTSFPWAVAVDDGTTANRVGIWHYEAPRTVMATSRVSGAASPELTGPTITAGSFFRAAFAAKAGSFGLSVNGGAAITSATGSLPAMSRLVIGGGDNAWNGYIRRLTIFPRALSSATLPLLTA